MADLVKPGMVRAKNGALHYKIVGIAPNRVVEGIAPRGAPSEAHLCARGKRWNAHFMIRYYPSKKGWSVLDIRRAFPAQGTHPRIVFWRGQQRCETTFSTEDAAVMWAMHHTGAEVAQ